MADIPNPNLSTRRRPQQLFRHLFDTERLHYLLYVLGAGFSVGVAVWEWRHLDLLLGFWLENQLAAAERFELLVTAFGGSAVFFVLWVFAAQLLVSYRQASLRSALDRVAAYALVGAPAALLPVLATDNVAREAEVLLLFVMAATLLLLFAALRAIAHAAVPTLSQARTSRPARREARVAGGVVAVASVSYAIFFSVRSLTRHHALLSNAFDLAIFDQLMYTMWHQGVQLSTLYGERTLNHFAVHFSPILYVLAPLYAVFTDAKTLLVAQSIILALSAVPLYLLARKTLGHTLVALALVFSLLLHPGLHGVNSFDFHEIALFVPLMLFTLWALESERTRLFVVLLFLCLLVKEETALSGVAVGLYLMVSKKRFRLGIAVSVASGLFFVVVSGVLLPLFGRWASFVPQFVQARYGGMISEGSQGTLGVIQTALSNPLYTLIHTLGDPDKLIYLSKMLLPVALLPLLAGRAWLIAAAALATPLLSSSPTQLRLDLHYPAAVLPFVYFLAVVAIGKLARKHYNVLAVLIVAASLLMTYSYGLLPFSDAPSPNRVGITVERLEPLLAQIPTDAGVSASNRFAPHVSARELIRLFPADEGVDYILFDARMRGGHYPVDRSAAYDRIFEVMSDGSFGVVDYDPQCCLLLGRDHSTEQNAKVAMSILAPSYEAEYMYGDWTHLAADAITTEDSAASGGRALYAYPDLYNRRVRPAGANYLTYGPYTRLPAGGYQVDFTLWVDNNQGARQVARLDVIAEQGRRTLAVRELSADDFERAGVYQTFSLDVEVPRTLDDVEYRVYYYGNGELRVDTVRVTPFAYTAQVLEARVVPDAQRWQDYTPSNIQDNEASQGEARLGLPELLRGAEALTLARSPSMSLEPASYQARVRLKRGISDYDGVIATLVARTPREGTLETVAQREFRSSDFAAPGQYQTFALDFATTEPGQEVEVTVDYYGVSALWVDRLTVGSARYQAEVLPSTFDAERSIADDTSAREGQARHLIPTMLEGTSAGSRFVTFGPYASLVPGSYVAHFVMRVDGVEQTGAVAQVDVVADYSRVTLGTRTVRTSDFAATSGYQPMTVPFEVSEPLDNVEYRVVYAGNAELWLDEIEIVPLAYATQRYEAEALPGNIGAPEVRNATDPAASRETARRAEPTMLSDDSAGDFVLYGPYARLEPGRYTVDFRIRSDVAERDEVADETPIAYVDVVAEGSTEVLARRTLNARDVRDSYQTVTLPVEVTQALANVEYRVFYYGAATLWVDTITLNPEVRFPHAFEAETLPSDLAALSTSTTNRRAPRTLSDLFEEGKVGQIVYPNTELQAGAYQARFRMKHAATESERPLATIEVRRQGDDALLAREEISAGSFLQADKYQSITLDFEALQPLQTVEITLVYHGVAQLWVDGPVKISARSTAPNALR